MWPMIQCTQRQIRLAAQRDANNITGPVARQRIIESSQVSVQNRFKVVIRLNEISPRPLLVPFFGFD